MSSSSLESSVSSHLMKKSSCIQQNSFDQSSSSNKRLQQIIKKKFKDVKNTELFEKINIKFNDFESSKRLNSDKDSDEEDLITKDILIIEDQ